MLIHGTMGRASEKRATQSAKHAEQERKVRQEEYRRIGRSVACGFRLLGEAEGARGEDCEDETEL